LFADQICAFGRRDRPVRRRQDPEQHAGQLGVRRGGGGRRAERRPTVAQPSGLDGRRQRVRGPMGRGLGRVRGRKRVPDTAGRHAAAPIRAARRVRRKQRGKRGPGPVPVRAGARRPRGRQPVHVRLRPAAHQRAQAQPGVPGPAAAGRGQPVRQSAGRQLLPATGQHNAGRLQGPAGQRDRVRRR